MARKETYAFTLTPRVKQYADEMAQEDQRQDSRIANSTSAFVEWLILKEKIHRRNQSKEK